MVVIALVAAAAGDRAVIKAKVESLVQSYANPKMQGAQKTGSCIVNNVHHLKPEVRQCS